LPTIEYIVIPAIDSEAAQARRAEAGIQKMKNFYVYILANKRNGTLYIGVTSDLIKRVWEHKNKLVDGFSKRYNTNILVYFEQATDARSAITREKQIKTWKREWKLELIEKENPEWQDLYEQLM